MDEARRSLIKGMFTGGTWLALGLPSIVPATPTNQPTAGKVQNYRLLLGNTTINEAFNSGANAAWTSYTHNQQGLLPVTKLETAILANPFGVAEVLQQSPGRWIAIMDDASAAIFTELIRSIDSHLLSLGLHTYSSDDTPLPLRHVWTTASPVFSAGGLLASRLAQNQHNFSIVEHFLAEAKTASNEAIRGQSISCFRSYRSAEQATMQLHCAGVSPVEASTLLGWKTSTKWESVPRPSNEHSTFPNNAANDAATEPYQGTSWVEATGYAIAATALGMETSQESCAHRAFVHRSNQSNQHRERSSQGLAQTHFVSFIVDV